jgi:hypothetical protein
MPSSPPRAPAGAYVAATCVVSVIAAVVLSRSTLGDSGEAILYWLIYTLTCGVLVNAHTGTGAGELFVYSLPAPSVLIDILFFEIALNGFTFVSGKRIELNQLGELWWLFALIWLMSCIGIWVFSFSRELVLLALTSLFSLSSERAGRIETTLNWLVRVVGIVGLLARVLVK